MSDPAVEGDAAACPFVERCPMYPAFQSEAALAVYKAAYCHRGDRFPTCERHKRATSGTMPPPDMLPDGSLLPSHWVEASESDD